METIINYIEILEIDGVYKLILVNRNQEKFIIDIDIKKIIKEDGKY